MMKVRGSVRVDLVCVKPMKIRVCVVWIWECNGGGLVVGFEGGGPMDFLDVSGCGSRPITTATSISTTISSSTPPQTFHHHSHFN